MPNTKKKKKANSTKQIVQTQSLQHHKLRQINLIFQKQMQKLK